MKIKDIVEARMSAAVKLQRAFEREQSKSTASRQRADQAKAEFEKEWKAKQEKEKQGVEEGLNEFAPPGSDDGGDDGFSEETLKRLAAQWWNGDEDPRVEKILAAAGWEIGQDEGGYDNGGAFVVQAGDVNGNSYMSWPAEELEQGVAEGLKSKMAAAALAAANLLGSPAQAAEEPVKPITIAYVTIEGEVKKYNLGDKFTSSMEAEKFISGVLDKQGLQGYHLEIKHGYPKKKNEDTAGVGIITKQNTTADVDKNTPKKNLRAFRL